MKRRRRLVDTLTLRVRALKLETHALYLASLDSRTPWYAKAIAFCVLAYALSPIDLIPDPIPVLGYLDDLILIPLGVVCVRLLIPTAVLVECRRRAAELADAARPKSPVGACLVIGLWLAAGVLLIRWLLPALRLLSDGSPSIANACQ